MLDTDDPIKGQLLQKSARHREQLEDEVKLISERTEKIIINALVIGGALAATYFLVSRFSGSKSKTKRKTKKIKLIRAEDSGQETLVAATATPEPAEPGIVSQITAALASQATVFLLALAKEKLAEFLASQAGPKEDKENEHP